MANYLTTDTALAAVADAIREKGGTSGQLVFPDGFVSAIDNLPGGGSSATPLTVTRNGTYTAPQGSSYSPVTVNVPTAPFKIVETTDSHGGTVRTITTLAGGARFYDYDGTLLYSYNNEEVAALTALPANPSHAGLVAQGWNWSLADIKSYVAAYPEAAVNVGQMYITESGNTEIDVKMSEGRLDPIMTIAVKGTITIDWGDETTPDTVTGTSLTSRKAVPHTYASAGEYTISIHAETGNTYSFYCSNTYLLLRKNAVANESRVYASCVRNVRFGSGITQIYNYAFYYCTSLASITIPNTVTSIRDSAFYCSYSLTSITIPSGVTSIGAATFQTCYSLKSITIPSSVTSIGTAAFQYCYSLTSITIPSSTTSVGSSAFYSCYSLTSITIPSGVTSIDGNMLQYCYSLESITIPDSVTSIGSSAFSGCYSLESITIPDSVTSIGSNAFSSCYSLESITIPEDVTSIGNSAFSSCYSLASITIPENVTSIGGSVFYNCYSLTSITIPEDVTSIGGSVFYNCYSLTSITIPEDVASIGDSAFNGCYSLASITIPENVTSIGTNVFQYCYGLKEIHMLPTTPPTLGNAITGIPSDMVIYVPQGTLSTYQGTTNWSSHASIMQEES